MSCLPAAPALAQPQPPQPQPTPLRWGYRAGDEHLYRLTQEEKTRTELPGGGTVEESQVQVMDLSCRVDRVDPAEGYALTWTYRRIRVRLEGPRFRVDWDSRNEPVDPREDPGAASFDFMRGLIDGPIAVRMDPRGNVLDVVGTEALIDGMVEGAAPRLRDMIREQLRGMIGEDQVRASFMSGLGVFPEEPAGPGAAWRSVQIVPLPDLGTLETAIDNRLRSFVRAGDKDEAVAVIAQDGSLELLRDRGVSPPHAPAGGAEAMDLRLTEGSLDGEIGFSLDRGIILRSRTRLAMVLVLAMPQGPGDTLTMTQHLHSQTTLRLLEGEDPTGGEDEAQEAVVPGK